MSWHIPEPMARAYVEGDVQGARAASIEAHVMTCEVCRELVGREVATERLDAIWSAIEEDVDSPRPRFLERLLIGVGLDPSDARLVAVAPSLHLAWFSALALVLLLAVWVSQAGERGSGFFLIVAPLVPVAAVAGAYGPWIDPTYEVSVSSPYPTMRLLLLRSAAVTAASGALAGVASLWVPDLRTAVAWVLPCLALVSLTLLLSRWMPLTWAAAGVAACYGIPLTSALFSDVDVTALVLSKGLQMAALIVAAASFVLIASDPQMRLALRRNR
ncbi:MAG: anti-sigma factor family protein [Actinomycetes bacterium]